jgi:hypothetical protein
MLLDERFELRHELGVTTMFEVRLHSLLQGGEPHLLQMHDVRLGERFEGKVREWRPAPERECLTKGPGALRGLLRPRLLDQHTEAVQVDFTRSNPKPITRRLRLENLSPQQFAELRDEVLERSPGSARRPFAPEGVDETFRRDDASRLEQEERQDCSLFLTSEEQRPGCVEDLQRA